MNRCLKMRKYLNKCPDKLTVSQLFSYLPKEYGLVNIAPLVLGKGTREVRECYQLSSVHCSSTLLC